MQLTGRTAREHDDALAQVAVGDQLPVDAGTVVVTIKVGVGDQLEEVAVAGLVLGEHRQVVRLLVTGIARQARARRDVALDADDRLDAARPGLAVEVDSAVEVAVVRHGDGFLAHFLDVIHQLRDTREAV